MRLYNTQFEKDILGKSKTYRIPGFEWQDIAQELDISLWQSLKKYDSKRGASVRTFAVRIMRNKILDLNKAVNRDKRRASTYATLFSELEPDEFEEAEIMLATTSLEEDFICRESGGR